MTDVATIFECLYDSVEALELPSGWTIEDNVQLPGREFAPQGDVPFLQTKVHYGTPIGTDIQNELPPIRPGFLQVNVMWPKTWGHGDAIEIAGGILDRYKRGTILDKDGVEVRIDEDPELGTIIEGPVHDTIPVTVRWIVYP